MSDAARTYSGYMAPTGGIANSIPTPKRETLADTLSNVRDAQGSCHAVANSILAKLGIPNAEPDANKLQPPVGALGLAMELRGSAMVLRDLLERIDQALG